MILSLIPPLFFVTLGPYLAVVLGIRVGFTSFSLPLARPAGLIFIACGLVLGVWCAWLLFTSGEGTPSPWMPPRRLVAEGPYLRVRNPMLLSLFFVLAGEALYVGSGALLLYLAGAVIFSHLYIVLIEERELENRFGEVYVNYKAKTPRWMPKLLKGN